MFLTLLAPAFSFVLLFFLEYSDTLKIRVSFMNATLKLGLFLFFITEVLSLWGHVNLITVLASWSIFLLVVLYLCLKKGIRIKMLYEIFEKVKEFIKGNNLSLIIPAFLFISLVIALIYPPNNFDSMTYHMARVGHWIMRESVHHYPTHILRQLIQPPFSEWILLHIQILSGGDRFANTMQTFFFAGCIMQASLIAQLLGGNNRQQLLSALFTCLVPMAIIQSNTTQNDVTVAFFTLAFVYYTMLITKERGLSSILLAGVAMGIAILTKGTAYLYCLVFSIWYLFVFLTSFRKPSFSMFRMAGLFLIIPAIALLINAGHFYRNFDLNGSLVGKGNEGVANEAHQLKPIMLVAVKNFMNHMPMSGGIKESLTKYAEKAGLDVNDPKYSFQTLEFMISGFSYHEDYAQNFWHAILILLFGIIFFINRDLYKARPGIFALFVITTYITIAAFCYLFKWQPWGNRLETTLFVLFSIVFGMIAGKYKLWLQSLILLPVLYTGAKSVLYSGNHPVLPWKENVISTGYDAYIYNKAEYEEEKIFFDTTSIKKFGLQLGPDSWDYPYYKMLSESKNKKFELAHVYVANESVKFDTGYVPEAYFTYDIVRAEDTLGGKKYYRSKIFGGRMALFEMIKE